MNIQSLLRNYYEVEDEKNLHLQEDVETYLGNLFTSFSQEEIKTFIELECQGLKKNIENLNVKNFRLLMKAKEKVGLEEVKTLSLNKIKFNPKFDFPEFPDLSKSLKKKKIFSSTFFCLKAPSFFKKKIESNLASNLILLTYEKLIEHLNFVNKFILTDEIKVEVDEILQEYSQNLDLTKKDDFETGYKICEYLPSTDVFENKQKFLQKYYYANEKFPPEDFIDSFFDKI